MSSSDHPTTSQQERLPKAWAGISLFVGITCGLLTHVANEHSDDIALSFSLSQALLLGSLLFVLSARPGKTLATSIFAVASALCLGLLSATSIYRFGIAFSENGGLLFLLAGQAIIFTYILLPFFQTWLDDGDFSFSYEGLFIHSWNNGLLALVGLGFMGLFWLILFLFSLLFESVGIDALKTLIDEPMFSIPATTSATALGVFVARDHARIVAALRAILFSLLSVLNPVFLFLALAFLVALSLGGFEKLSSVISASATLLSLITIGVVLSNAVLRDGSETLAANKLLRIGTIALLPALLCFSGFAAYAIYLRISDYGLTPERVWIAVGTGILAVYSIAYVASFISRGRWMSVCRRANVFIALAVAAIALVMQTPFADPFVLSARSQYDRLITGATDAKSFDYGFLKFELGAPGRETLTRISEDSGAAERDTVVAQLDLLAKTNQQWEWRRQVQESANNNQITILRDPTLVELVPSTLQLPESLFSANLPQVNPMLKRCGQTGGPDCIISAIDLSDSPGEELIFAMRETNDLQVIYVLELREEEWRSVLLGYDETGRTLWEDLRSGKLSAVPSRFRDLKVGDKIIRFRD